MTAVKLVLLLALALAPPLSGCERLKPLFTRHSEAEAKVTIKIESAKLPPGGRATIGIYVAVMGPSGVAEIQVGPREALTFDPEVVQLRGITGVGGFTLLASEIDNLEGEARFAAGSLQGEVFQGRILELEIEALGEPGKGCELELTGVDMLLDGMGNELAPVATIAGEVEVE